MPEIKTEKYQVLKALEHDGRAYRPGDSIEMQQENAAYLLRKRAIGAIDQPAEKAAAGNTGKKENKA
jgi:hypothetical protein